MVDKREIISKMGINKLEKQLLLHLSEDCINMPGRKEGERELGFFTCAGSMFAILEAEGLTTMKGSRFIEKLDEFK